MISSIFPFRDCNRTLWSVALFLLSLSSCAVLERSEEPTHHRGSLSQALEKSRDGATDRHVGHRDSERRDPSVFIGNEERHRERSRSEEPTPFLSVLPVAPLDFSGGGGSASFGISTYYIQINDENFNNVIGIGPTLKLQDPASDFACDFYLAGEIYDVKPRSDFTLGAEDVFGICGGINGKYYLNSSKVFASPYLGAGIAVGSINWKYRNPLIGDEGEKIRSDSLTFGQIEAFTGLQFWRKQGLSLSGQIGGLVRLNNFETSEKFTNDFLWGNAGIKTCFILEIHF
jgi:hypothetical protein